MKYACVACADPAVAAKRPSLSTASASSPATQTAPKTAKLPGDGWSENSSADRTAKSACPGQRRSRITGCQEPADDRQGVKLRANISHLGVRVKRIWASLRLCEGFAVKKFMRKPFSSPLPAVVPRRRTCERGTFVGFARVCPDLAGIL